MVEPPVDLFNAPFIDHTHVSTLEQQTSRTYWNRNGSSIYIVASRCRLLSLRPFSGSLGFSRPLTHTKEPRQTRLEPANPLEGIRPTAASNRMGIQELESWKVERRIIKWLDLPSDFTMKQDEIRLNGWHSISQGCESHFRCGQASELDRNINGSQSNGLWLSCLGLSGRTGADLNVESIMKCVQIEWAGWVLAASELLTPVDYFAHLDDIRSSQEGFHGISEERASLVSCGGQCRVSSEAPERPIGLSGARWDLHRELVARSEAVGAGIRDKSMPLQRPVWPHAARRAEKTFEIHHNKWNELPLVAPSKPTSEPYSFSELPVIPRIELRPTQDRLRIASNKPISLESINLGSQREPPASIPLPFQLLVSISSLSCLAGSSWKPNSEEWSSDSALVLGPALCSALAASERCHSRSLGSFHTSRRP